MYFDNIFSLEGKKILVTGASSGIGKTIANTLSQQKASVVLSGRDVIKLQDTMSSLIGNSHHIITADLTKQEDLQNLSKKIEPLDGVIFCAGIIYYMIAKNIDMQSFENVMNVNYKCQIALYQQLHINKKLKKNSSLVFISSVAALSAVPATLAYAASKASINSSVKILAKELSKVGIRVNSISPGLIETSLFDASALEKESIDMNLGKYPLGLGKAEDVANTAVFLLSDASRWITGTNIIVDGGYLLND